MKIIYCIGTWHKVVQEYINMLVAHSYQQWSMAKLCIQENINAIAQNDYNAMIMHSQSIGSW